VNSVPIVPKDRPGYIDNDLPIKAYRNFNKLYKQYVIERKDGVHEILAQSECDGSVIWEMIKSMPASQRPPEIGLQHYNLP
jgi:hypothetical protein